MSVNAWFLSSLKGQDVHMQGQGKVIPSHPHAPPWKHRSCLSGGFTSAKRKKNQNGTEPFPELMGFTKGKLNFANYGVVFLYPQRRQKINTTTKSYIVNSAH